MSSPLAVMYHPVTSHHIKVWQGFSWPCLATGLFWYIHKGMWSWAIIALISLVITLGLSWFLFPLFANEHYNQHLKQQGYLTQAEWALTQIRQQRIIEGEAEVIESVSLTEEAA